MESPSKHHFNPAFSLKPWAGSDGKVCQMRKIGRAIDVRRVHPNATGFQRDLYRIDGVGPDQAQHVERNFFKPLDSEAALTLQRMLASRRPPTDNSRRSAWARYLLSLIFRMPITVGALKSHMSEVWDVSIKSLKEDYERKRLPTAPQTAEEYLSLRFPAAAEISAANMLMEIIDNDEAGPTIVNMHWSCIDLRKSNVELLCSDSPIDRPLGLGDPRAYIALPMAPKVLFLASNDARFADYVSNRNHTKTAKEVNKTVVTQAREFVWGSNNSQFDFVAKNIATAELRDFMTPEQRAQAMAAATGQV